MGPAHPRSVGVRAARAAIGPPTAGDGEACLALVPHLSSIGHGRRWVAAEAARHGVGATGLRVVQLLASELIANAVLHGPPGGAVTVRTHRAPDRLRVEVDDADSTTRPRLVHRERADAGGRGLMLVDRFADRWGYDLHGDDGKTVWFEYLLPSGEGRRRPPSGSDSPTGPGEPAVPASPGGPADPGPASG